MTFSTEFSAAGPILLPFPVFRLPAVWWFRTGAKLQNILLIRSSQERPQSKRPRLACCICDRPLNNILESRIATLWAGQVFFHSSEPLRSKHPIVSTCRSSPVCKLTPNMQNFITSHAPPCWLYSRHRLSSIVVDLILHYCPVFRTTFYHVITYDYFFLLGKLIRGWNMAHIAAHSFTSGTSNATLPLPA